MTDEEVATALSSDAPMVVVDAPAGTGKTHMCARLAGDFAAGLSGGREVLLLAHTHAAIDEFRSRLGNQPGIRYETIDSFALDLLRAHPQASGLPLPLRPDHARASEWFAALTRSAADLLERAPGVARQIALHHPLVFLDEHQDARQSQHAIALRLRDAGARIRVLGDPLQSIYEFGEEPAVHWSDVCDEGDLVVHLETPHRWRANLEFGEWLMAARQALLAGRPLPLSDAPETVRRYRMNGVGDANFRTKHVAPGLGKTLSHVLRSLRGETVVLVPYNDNVFGVRSATGRRIHVHEGHDLKLAHGAIEAAIGAAGDAEAMVEVGLRLAERTCTGVTKKVRDDVKACFKGGTLSLGRRRVSPPLVDLLNPLTTDPTVKGLAGFALGVLKSPPTEIKPELRETLNAVAMLAIHETDDPHGVIAAHARGKRAAAVAQDMNVMTIHKAKGRAFDHVVVVHCSAGAFAQDEHGARLLYVAMTRARVSLHLLASDTHPSPFLGS